MHTNFKNVGKTVFGRGSFDQLGDILTPTRENGEGYVVFLVDDYFRDHELLGRLPADALDLIEFVDASHDEPTTWQVDALRDSMLGTQGVPGGVVGIGGGSIMDLAKALSLMFTNEGSSASYQGLNLINRPGVWHCGIPTISGTGAECSMTAVLSGPEKKLGLKCEWTPFDQLVLDPDLPASVPRNHWFYTGMDCYIHCCESESGRHKNAFSRAYGDQALSLCRDVYLGAASGQTPENDEKLMVASLFGGLSLTYSEVGVCHALSYGLSFVLKMRHGLANCVAFGHLEEFYGSAVKEFNAMAVRHDIEIPRNLADGWSEEQVTQMAEVALALGHMWDHAIGPDWSQKVSLDRVKDLYRRM
jgi:3-deoxy-alpha-D-manno-octulosonate 8-oxidase